MTGEGRPPPNGWDPNRHRKYARAQWVSDGDMLGRIVDETRGLATGGTVIELGCGLGNVIAAFVDEAKECVGVDHDENMLAQAARQDAVRYVHGAIQTFSAPAAEVVVARNVIHYVGAEVLFSKGWDLLRPGGLLLVCQAVPPSTAARAWHDAMHDMMGVQRAPSTDDLVAGFRLHGFGAISSVFHFHRMQLGAWLDARVEDLVVREQVLRHHGALAGFPEFESRGEGLDMELTVRFAVVVGLKPA